MKLCIVASGNFFSTYGGGQVYVQRLVDELLQQGKDLAIDLSIVSFHDTFPMVAREKQYREAPLYELHPFGDLEPLLRQIAPDVVHAHGEKKRVARCCQVLQIPCLVTAHHGGIVCPAGALLDATESICARSASLAHCLPCYLHNIRSGRYWYPLLKRISPQRQLRWGCLLRNKPFIPFVTPIGQATLSISEKLEQWRQLADDASLFVSPSHALALALLRNGARSENITVLPHGVTLPTEIPQKETFATGAAVKFYYVGRLCHIKGIHILLDAFHRLTYKPIELHIIGTATGKADQRYTRRLQRRYRRDHRIVWHGKIAPADVASLSRAYHCLVHPAICMEAFGLDIAEALSQGHHVIATRCGGAEMQIDESKLPWLVEPNDSNALFRALDWYVKYGYTCHEAHRITSLHNHAKALAHIYHHITYRP